MVKIKQVTPSMRRWLLIDTLLVLAVGVQLFVLTEQTERLFAWTIAPPNNRYLTAAFMGAAYWASLFLVFLASREKIWARARIAIPGVWVFTLLTLITTLMHLSLFHLNPPLGAPAEPLTYALTLVWLAVYVMVPIAIPIVTFIQLRSPGVDPPRVAPLAWWMRGLLALLAVGLVALGALFFINPTTSAGLWPWKLTPLTTRAVAAWLVGIGVVSGHMALENDLTRIRAGLTAFVALALFQTMALLRYASEVSLSDARLWVYVVALTAFLLVGLVGLVRRPREQLVGGMA